MMNPSPHQTLSVGIAMSGGVDSSVTAYLLRERGFSVHGFFMALQQPDLTQQIARVQEIADFLGIELTVIDLAREFEQHVLDYCSVTYLNGRTPNPCMVCNYKIKFGKLLETITDRGLSFQATGHYARIAHEQGAPSRLLKGLDPKKDQSYFLSRLTQQQISRLLLPLGEQTKTKVYQLAEQIGLKGLHGKESQDVCFLKGNTLGSFLNNRLGHQSLPGSIVTVDNKILGEHQGLVNFTVGQRRGLGVPDATPYYVLSLDVEKNQVIAGKKQDLFRTSLVLRNINWISGSPPDLPQNFMVKIRYRHRAASATISASGDTSIETVQITFQEPQLAVTPGQFAVFYRDDEVLGSGEIC
jgi:tRNA-specific 2-thiouridylase